MEKSKIFSFSFLLPALLPAKVFAASKTPPSFMASIPILPVIILVLILIVAGIIFYLQFKKSREIPYNLPSSLSPPSPPSPPSPSIPETTPLSPLTQTVQPSVQPDLGADLPLTPPNQISSAPPKSQLPFSQPVLIGTALVLFLAIITIGLYFIIRKKPTILVQTIPCGQTTCDPSIQYCDNGVCKQKITPAGDGPGGCCSPGLSPEQGGCRSNETCDIANGACTTNLSCRAVAPTPGPTGPCANKAPGVYCEGVGNRDGSTSVLNCTTETKNFTCQTNHTRFTDLTTCNAADRTNQYTGYSTLVVPPYESRSCSTGAGGTCDIGQVDILGPLCWDTIKNCTNCGGTPTPTRILTPTPTTPTTTGTPTPTIRITPTPTTRVTPTPTTRITPTPTRRITLTPTPTRVITVTPTPTRVITLTPTPTGPTIPQCRNLRVLINDAGVWRDINDSEKANLSSGTILRLALPTLVNGYNPTKAEFRVIINGATDLEKDTTDIMIVAGIPYYYLEITTKLIDSLTWSSYTIYGWLFINGGWH